MTLRAYAIDDGAQIRTIVPAPDGTPSATFMLQRMGDRITVQLRGRAPGWRFLLVGQRILSVDGGSVAQAGEGAYVTPDADAEQIVVRLGMP